MSRNNQQEIPVAYPPPMEKQGPMPMPPPPVGYPTTDVPKNQVPLSTQSRGDGFWKGCCAALCCCCVLDACF